MLDELIENCRENGENMFADFLVWQDVLMDATPDNVDRLLADFAVWADSHQVPVPLGYADSYRKLVFYFAERERPH